MGLVGWFSWLSEDVDKLKTVRAMTKDAEQIKILDEVIADIEKNSEKGE